jgi:hypothetical protein
MGAQGTGAAPAAPQPLNFSNPAVTAAELVYPSSHTAAKQRAPTDWNKLEQELKEEEKDEKLEGALGSWPSRVPSVATRRRREGAARIGVMASVVASECGRGSPERERSEKAGVGFSAYGLTKPVL